MGAQGDEADPVVFRIAEQTNRLIQARRRKEEARQMAKLMKNFNYDLLRGSGDESEVESQGVDPEDLELDEEEAERIRRLREVEEEIAAGVLARATAQPNKYESPLIRQLRSIETVDEMYHLADKIIPLTPKNA